MNLAPWVLAILYDLLYYIGRQIWHEIPFVGGRARGAQRPRAPSLRERTRRVSFRQLLAGAGEDGAGSAGKNAHTRGLSRESIEEEKEDGDGGIDAR